MGIDEVPMHKSQRPVKGLGVYTFHFLVWLVYLVSLVDLAFLIDLIMR